jgi:hypothetical protein
MSGSEMESQRWRRLEALFVAATELEPGERGPWLEAQCGDDTNLLNDVQVLLEADKRASDGHFIVDAIELAAHQFARDRERSEERRAKSEDANTSHRRGRETI